MSIAGRLGRIARSVAHDVAKEGARRLRSRSGGGASSPDGGRGRETGPSSGGPRGAGATGSRATGSGTRGSRATSPGRAGSGTAPLDVGRAEQRRLDVVTEYDAARDGRPRLDYAPREDDRPDPGEVVWAWVPYDENDGRGKDRPVLVLARLDGAVLGAQMTSKDRADGGVHTDRYDRTWIDVGTGAWDGQGRDSEVRLDRLLRLPDDAVRREGAALDRASYERVTDALESRH